MLGPGLFHVVLLSLAAIVTGGLAGYAWHHRLVPGARPLSAALVAVTAWTTTEIFALSQTGASHLFWERVQWAPIAVAPIFFFFFIVRFTGYEWVLTEDGDIVARSTLTDLMESVLLINSDLYKTGAIELESVSLPDVLTGLEEVPFRLRGYPVSNKEKLLLIVVSRVIERIAAETGGGTLRSSFQRLSRLNDERGTYDVYRTVADRGVDVHIYGTGDLETDEPLPMTVHRGSSYPYRRSWFVVFTPPAADAGDYAALLALEDEPNVWDGFWTFRPDLVAPLESYIAEHL